MANVDAANGDTVYTLNAAQDPFVLQLGNTADGQSVWIANLDPTAVVTVEWSGSHAGVGRINLSGTGDSIVIPGGDITSVTITANVHPAIIGWAYLDHGFSIRTAFAESGLMGPTTGLTELVSTQTAAAGALAPSLAGVGGHTTYCTGFEITGTGATATSTIAVTLTGLVGGVTATYFVVIPAGAALAVTPLVVEFPRPLAAVTGGAITLNVPSFGAGNLNASAVLHGYRV